MKILNYVILFLKKFQVVVVFFFFFFFFFVGSEIADVVNCRNGVVIERFKVGDFWEGFESIKGLFVSILSITLCTNLVVIVVVV